MTRAKNLTRRDFLRGSAMTAVGALVAACARATPVVVEKEVPIEKEIVRTVVVEKEVPVEKVVKETVIVEKVVTATPAPSKYKEAPMLAELVRQGKLPPIEDRLPLEPRLCPTVESIGRYSDNLQMLAQPPGTGDMGHVYA